jgi:hypothetical protein
MDYLTSFGANALSFTASIVPSCISSSCKTAKIATVSFGLVALGVCVFDLFVFDASNPQILKDNMCHKRMPYIMGALIDLNGDSSFMLCRYTAHLAKKVFAAEKIAVPLILTLGPVAYNVLDILEKSFAVEKKS